MTDKKTGRPPKYTEEQVIRGIEIVERAGEAPSGDTVKKAMCSQLDVALGINTQSLDKEVHRLIAERERFRREQLIAKLPSESLSAAKEIGSFVVAAVLEHLGEQHEELQIFAQKKLVALNSDFRNQREQIRDLLIKVDTKDEEISALEETRHELEGRLHLADAEIHSLKERIASFEREEDFQTKMLAVMEKTLGGGAGL